MLSCGPSVHADLVHMIKVCYDCGGDPCELRHGHALIKGISRCRVGLAQAISPDLPLPLPTVSSPNEYLVLLANVFLNGTMQIRREVPCSSGGWVLSYVLFPFFRRKRSDCQHGLGAGSAEPTRYPWIRSLQRWGIVSDSPAGYGVRRQGLTPLGLAPGFNVFCNTWVLRVVGHHWSLSHNCLRQEEFEGPQIT